jgi:hypothetical protein
MRRSRKYSTVVNVIVYHQRVEHIKVLYIDDKHGVR